jgi:NAD(P)-dependent dehydrogenase (short-subunit alcohol dehydrogenase family)
MRGRVCLVTGGSRGIGKATALGLARLGASVIVLARDARAGARAVDEVRRVSGSDDGALVVADLASLSSLRAAAAEVASRWKVLHVLVNNAGVSLSHRAVSADGYEMTFAVNHLAPFALTLLLMPLLRAGAQGRVITVSSVFERWGRIDFDDLHGSRRYNGTRAYTQSKLANVLFTYALAERFADGRVTANCVFPGLVATDLMRDRVWWRVSWLAPLWRRLFRTPERGAQSSIFAASSPTIAEVSGRCFSGARPVRTSRRSYDAATRDRLWRVSAELTGVGTDDPALPDRLSR